MAWGASRRGSGLANFPLFCYDYRYRTGGILVEMTQKAGGQSQGQKNMLGTMPVNRLVLAMSSPIMISMLMSAVYNLVDSIYVAQVSDLDFLALSYAYPVQLMMVAFCTGVGVGFNATFAQRLGEGKGEEANQVACHGFLFYGLCWLLFLLFALFGAPVFFRLSTPNGVVAQAGVEYLTICCGWSIGMCMQFLTERLLQTTGHPSGFMIVQGSGALLNIILDPVFIFGFDMGVTGAAVATVIGQISGACIGFFLLWRIRREFSVSFRGFRPSGAISGEMLRIAAPAIVMQSLSSFMSLGLNQLLTRWSQTAVFVLGVYFKIQTFVFMPIFGVSNGLIPIVSYNYGARSAGRITRAIRFSLTLAVGTGLGGAVILALAASPLLRVCFQAGAQAVSMGTPALRMTALAFPVAAVSIILSASFQSLGRSGLSLLVSLLRQIVLLLPIAAGFLALVPELTWLSFLCAEVLACLTAAVCYRRAIRPRIRALEEGQTSPSRQGAGAEAPGQQL